MNAMMDKPTKAISKAGRRARKRESRAVDPMGLAEVPRKQRNGRTHRTPEDRDHATDALAARCRQMGKPPTPENLRDMRAPWWGCHAGIAIGKADLTHDQRLILWDASQHMLKVWQGYYRAIGHVGRYPKCMSILAPANAMQADASSPPLDDRTEPEKYRAAVSAMMRVEGFLGRISATAAAECKRAVLDDQPVQDAPGLLAGLRVVADGMAGR